MGIKTFQYDSFAVCPVSLKNLPTTWGLKLWFQFRHQDSFCSEKPPHHMGIKTHALGVLHTIVSL